MRNIAEDVKLGKVKSEYNKREQGPDPGKETSSKIPLGLRSAAISLLLPIYSFFNRNLLDHNLRP
ncbi:hypothetical protein D1609_16085 [Leptospira borgpetersenii serovar Hardjo-bovis]|nr:hypothetical protein LBHB_01665 [Leptospira borgpetersenii serovar Hardjo]AYR09710.1 hypothetical protein D1609_16085 [Leptospira borgpetersenii serovar Hardjo-bovis]TQE52147.1 hypothetical protein FFZ96_16780 [Leptospira borgpetersenii]